MLTGPQKSAAAPASGRDSQISSQILTHRLDAVHARIVAAALRSKRSPDAITLLAVSKQQPVAAVHQLAAAGQRDFGENYLQEALPKIDESADRKLIWHYIGQIQSNKTRPIAAQFDWVHTVDRLKIAARLSEQRPKDSLPLNVCIQVKLADEAAKGGATSDEAVALAPLVAKLPRLRLRGLMCIPPPRDGFDEQLGYFRQCADLLRTINAGGLQLDTLSMGMSDDLEAAIAAGATIVRVGTAIYGERTAGGPSDG